MPTTEQVVERNARIHNGNCRYPWLACLNKSNRLLGLAKRKLQLIRS
ncbi:hypothetical protein [Pseudomonas sp. MYb185]|nr:hypothetical protein [Pseudomonas sp. MYb185]